MARIDARLPPLRGAHVNQLPLFPLACPACFPRRIPARFGTHIVHAQQQLYPSLKDSVPNITTNGVASAEVVPDIATISIGVDTERPNAADSARDTQAVVGEIKAQGIEAKDIKTLSITLSPVYDESTDANGRIIKRTLRGYSAHNSLSVRSGTSQRPAPWQAN